MGYDGDIAFAIVTQDTGGADGGPVNGPIIARFLDALGPVPDPPRGSLLRRLRGVPAGRAGACPRAWPAPAPPGSPGPPRSAPGERCGAGSAAAHGSASPSSPAAVRTVKSAGATWSRSSQATGNDTGAPGRTRGLYAAATVAPPARVESRNTLPPRSSRMNAVVASSGSSRSARAAIARVAAATSSGAPRRFDRHEHVHALGPAGLDRAGQARSASAWRTRNAARRPARTRPGAAGRGPAPGASAQVRRSPDQGRVVLDRPLVGEPEQRPPVVAQRVGHLPPGGLRPQPHRAPSPACTSARSSA